MKKWFFILVVFAGIAGCIKPPGYSEVPAIEFVSVSKTTVTEYDSITIVFSFTDGDGDIGADPNTTTTDTLPYACKVDSNNNLFFQDPYKTVFIMDLRDSCYMGIYQAGYIEPKGKFPQISGEFHIITLPITCKKFPVQPQDVARFQIRIKDRAGHFSNVIYTPQLTVNCL